MNDSVQFYVMRLEAKIKCGISSNIRSRISQIATGTIDEPILLFRSVYMSRADGRRAESIMHKYLAESHIGREWYWLPIAGQLCQTYDSLIPLLTDNDSTELWSAVQWASDVIEAEYYQVYLYDNACEWGIDWVDGPIQEWQEMRPPLQRWDKLTHCWRDEHGKEIAMPTYKTDIPEPRRLPRLRLLQGRAQKGWPEDGKEGEYAVGNLRVGQIAKFVPLAYAHERVLFPPYGEEEGDPLCHGEEVWVDPVEATDDSPAQPGYWLMQGTLDQAAWQKFQDSITPSDQKELTDKWRLSQFGVPGGACADCPFSVRGEKTPAPCAFQILFPGWEASVGMPAELTVQRTSLEAGWAIENDVWKFGGWGHFVVDLDSYTATGQGGDDYLVPRATLRKELPANLPARNIEDLLRNAGAYMAALGEGDVRSGEGFEQKATAADMPQLSPAELEAQMQQQEAAQATNDAIAASIEANRSAAADKAAEAPQDAGGAEPATVDDFKAQIAALASSPGAYNALLEKMAQTVLDDNQKGELWAMLTAQAQANMVAWEPNQRSFVGALPF